MKILTNCSVKRQNSPNFRAFLNSSQFFSMTTTRLSSKNKCKSIILHKRQLLNTATIEKQNCPEKSTGKDEGNCSLASKSFGKKNRRQLHSEGLQQPATTNFLQKSSISFVTKKLTHFSSVRLKIIKLSVAILYPFKWIQEYEEKKTYFKTDQKEQTFIFSVNKNQKFTLAKVKKNKAICCFKKWRPTFGGGYDLQIGDKADVSSSCSNYFPRSYTSSAKVANHKNFTGTKNKQFKLIEWQVYKVIKIKAKNQRLKQRSKQQKEGIGFLSTVKQGLIDLFFLKKE